MPRDARTANLQPIYAIALLAHALDEERRVSLAHDPQGADLRDHERSSPHQPLPQPS